jgi:25S rRNA (adenine2142-N1)-methyltransferase
LEAYYQPNTLERWRQKDLRTIEKLNEVEKSGIVAKDDSMLELQGKIQVLDVGSSGNFFKMFENFEILPLDISPSDDSVFSCDFLSVPLDNRLDIKDKSIKTLPTNHFHAVIFCLLLEYLPSSTQRIKCCQKAYEVLKHQGILIIITPDSSHEMKNSKQIKTWRWTLSKLGFTRIKVEKLMNLTCMAFRKSIAREVPEKWAESHSDNMEFEMTIPQDRNIDVEEGESGESCEFDADLMGELAQFS